MSITGQRMAGTISIAALMAAVCVVAMAMAMRAQAADAPRRPPGAAPAHAAAPATAAGASGYTIAKQWALPAGGGTRWDYLTMDSDGGRVFIVRDTHVSVVDAKTGDVLGDIAGVKGGHGVALAPELARGFVTSGGDDSVIIFDAKTLKPIETIKVGKKPDAILFDAASGRVFAMNNGGTDTTAIDAATGKVAGTVELGGNPESGATDGKGKAWVNIEDKGEVVEFDTKDLKPIAHFKLDPAKTPTGLAIDREHNRLFVGCRSKHMQVLDADTGKVLATLPIGTGVDACGFDPKTGLAFASCGDGTIAVVEETAPGKFEVIDTLKTANRDKTMTLDPKTHNLYVAANVGTPPAFTVIMLSPPSGG